MTIPISSFRSFFSGRAFSVVSRQAGHPRNHAVAILGLALASAAHGYSVVNPSFQGGLYGWTIDNEVVVNDGPDSPDVPFGSGPYDPFWSYSDAAATANDSTSPATLSQVITGVPVGERLYLSFDAATYDTYFRPTPGNNGVSASFEGLSITETGISADSITDSTWQHFTATAIATSSTGTLIVSMFDDPAAIDVTNVQVVPEPVPLAAVSLGVIGLLIRRRRRQ